MDRIVDFYFDFVSPYSYLAHHTVPDLVVRHGYALRYHPVDLKTAKLLAGNTGPRVTEIPIKLTYSRVDQRRWSERYGIPMRPPQGPHDPTRLNRGTFFAIDRNQAREYVTCAWHKFRADGASIESDETLRDIAGKLGWDAATFIAFADSDAADRRYQEATKAAHARGVFGVPTMMIGDEMWWGNDRLDFFEEYLKAQGR